MHCARMTGSNETVFGSSGCEEEYLERQAVSKAAMDDAWEASPATQASSSCHALARALQEAGYSK